MRGDKLPRIGPKILNVLLFPFREVTPTSISDLTGHFCPFTNVYTLL